MRLIFAGTPAFASTALARLQAEGFDTVLVLTQPDRPAGRGMKLQASPVKQLAMTQDLALVQPRGLRLDGRYAVDAAAARSAMEQARADAMVVAAYGLILPAWALALPRLGCLNIHASLLPRWRGAAPIHRAIEAGDRETGVTIMQMDAGLDTGDMLLAEPEPIHPHDTCASLHDRLAALGARLIVQALHGLAAGTLASTPQPVEGITYASKVDKAEAAIDWATPARVIERRVRAFDPNPGSTAVLNGETLKIWSADVVAQTGLAAPGTVLAVAPTHFDVATSDAALRVLEVQRPGGRRLPVAQFLSGFAVAAGMVLT